MRRKSVIFLFLITICIIFGCGKKYYDSNGQRVLNGFAEVDEIGTCFIDDKGKIITDCIKNINDKLYCFDENGKLQKGVFEYAGEKYFTEQDGAFIKNSMIYVNKIPMYYLDENGKIVKNNSWQEIRGKFSFNNVDIGANLISGSYIQNGEKTYIKNTIPCRGIVDIENKKYIFDEEGQLVNDKNNILSKKVVNDYNDETFGTEMDSLFLGNYFQQANSDEKTPIEWIILNNFGNFKLISKYVLDNISLSDLNNVCKSFYNDAFNDEEKEVILNGNGGISIMNQSDYKSYFGAEIDLNKLENGGKPSQFPKGISKATKYAKSNGAKNSYWLQGTVQNKQSYEPVSGLFNVNTTYHLIVEQNGIFTPCNDEMNGFRPVINIDPTKYSKLNIDIEKIKKMQEEKELANDSIIENIKEAKTVKEVPEDYGINQFDTVVFGKFPQTDNSGKKREDIEWIILDKNENSALLMSKYILNYHDAKGTFYTKDSDKSVDIDPSTLVNGLPPKSREWLNGEFYDYTFNDEEKKLMLPCNHEGINSNDYVELPNIKDIKEYLSEKENDKLFVEETPYANNKRKKLYGSENYPFYSLSNFSYDKSVFNVKWIRSKISMSASNIPNWWENVHTNSLSLNIGYRPIIRVSLKETEEEE